MPFCDGSSRTFLAGKSSAGSVKFIKITIEDSEHGTSQFRYDTVGNLAGATFADGVLELRQPDAVGNLFRTQECTDRQYGKGGQLREAGGTRFRYDEEGNLTRKTMPDDQQWHYAWDGAGQLVKVMRPDGYAVTWGGRVKMDSSLR